MSHMNSFQTQETKNQYASQDLLGVTQSRNHHQRHNITGADKLPTIDSRKTLMQTDKRVMFRNASSFYNETIKMDPQPNTQRNLLQVRQKSHFLKYLTDQNMITDRVTKKVPDRLQRQYNPVTQKEMVYLSVSSQRPEKREDTLYDKTYKKMVRNPSSFKQKSGDFTKSIDNKNTLQRFLRNNKKTIEKEDDA